MDNFTLKVWACEKTRSTLFRFELLDREPGNRRYWGARITWRALEDDRPYLINRMFDQFEHDTGIRV